jgi:uncharacterized membrane-anchored protein YhcB (DUF1043 family)
MTDTTPKFDPIPHLQQEIERLRKERDEARREICESTAESADLYPREFAEKMGWDCYKENTDD